MRSLMQDTPLGVHLIRERAEDLFGRRSVVGRGETITYAEVIDRAARIAAALDELGVSRSATVGTFAWNTPDHLATYLAVPCSGRVLHTVNIRMHPAQISYTLKHAADEVVVVDHDLVTAFADVELPATVKHLIVTGDVTDAAALAERTGSRCAVHALKDLASTPVTGSPWVTVDEAAAAGVCYTSGTTGRPKGIVYSQRSTYLHALTLLTVDAFAIEHADVTMPVVPMFHANAWGLPYASMLAGAGQALPGPDTSLAGLCELVSRAGVTMSAGVPTVWQEAAQQLRSGALRAVDLAPLRRIVIGGSALPSAMAAAFEDAGIRVLHAWGMTECSPVGLVAFDPVDADEDRLRSVRLTQGRPLPGLRTRVVSLASDGTGEAGELQVSGPWVADSYLDEAEASAEQFARCEDRTWLRTGDVAEIDDDGHVQLVDRTKDLIKSGGEWISSVDLEDRLTSHPGVEEAAVISVADPRWGERPHAYVVVAGADVGPEDLTKHLARQVARWQIPDGFTLVSELPRTSVGKIDKKRIRAEHGGAASARS